MRVAHEDLKDIDKNIPLCVDLDGTLVKSDLLVEGFLQCIKLNFLNGFRALFWLMRGKAHLKAEIAARTSINTALLPPHSDFLAWLRAEHQRGRRLVLCTAANAVIAAKVAAQFGIFEKTIASDATRNLSGRTKAVVLEELYGLQGFDYAGNEAKDIYVWNKARRAIVVAPGRSLRRAMHKVPRIERTFSAGAEHPLVTWFAALRIHQWAKNLLVFLPAVASHRIFETEVLKSSLLAFVWFGLCASATYLINDMLDLEADRAHPRKRYRPLASGALPLSSAIVGALLLLAASIVGAMLTLNVIFLGVLMLYLAGTLWYSFALKKIAMVDVLSLAGLYTVRVLAGGAAVAVIPSFWLLGFSMFIFFSLATAKRYTELRSALALQRTSAMGRGYTTDDLPLLLSCGTSAGFIAVLVLALYMNLAAEVLYRHPQALWLVCPLMLYWICRVWRKTHHGELHDDPVVFAIKDPPSLAVLCMCGLLVWVAV